MSAANTAVSTLLIAALVAIAWSAVWSLAKGEYLPQYFRRCLIAIPAVILGVLFVLLCIGRI